MEDIRVIVRLISAILYSRRGLVWIQLGRGRARRVGVAVRGSSGQKCLG